MPRRYDKSDLRMEANGAKMSTDKLRKELGLRKPRTEIATWKKPYEVLANVKTKVIEEPKPKRPKPPFKKPIPRKKGIQYKKAF